MVVPTVFKPAICLLAFFVCGSVVSVAAEPTDLMEFNDTTSVTWVMVPLVAHTQGLDRPLREDDLRVTVDGQAIDVGDLQRDRDDPSTLLLFQDLSGSMSNGGKIEASQRAARCLLDQARPGDQMAVVTFAAGKTFVEVPITPQLDEVSARIDDWDGYGSTALHDAVSWIPEVRLGHHRGLAAVLITDGVDNASVLTPEAARAMVQQAELPVYVIALRGSRLAWRRGAAKKPRLGHLQAPAVDDGFRPYSQVLKQLAGATGGRYFEAFFSDDIDTACNAVVNDLQQRYTFSFPLETRGPESFHDLRVTVPGRNFTLRHRAGYVGRAPSTLATTP